MRSRVLPAGTAALVLLAPGVWAQSAAPRRADPPSLPAVPADPPPRLDDRLTFRADRLDAGAALGNVTLQGGVVVAYDRYRLRGTRLDLRVERGAVVFAGDVHAALCSCADPPITFLAAGGRFEPPGDLVLRFPRVAVAGVPVFALPWLWLRAPDRVGILPPLLTVRGADGLLLGAGVHLPWRGSGGGVEALDLLAGGYVKGGVEIGARLVTAGSDASMTADLVRGTRVALEARGAIVPEAPSRIGAAWTMDADRGGRARSGTVDLAAAALPFDTAAAEVSGRAEVGSVSAMIAGGAVARALRGEEPIAAGPRATLALGGAIGAFGSWSADAAGVVLGDGGSGAAIPALVLGRASAGAEIDARPGPFEVRAGVRARAEVAGDQASSEAAAAARMDLELPFARAFDAGAPGDAPWVHWITPSLSLRGALAEQHGPFFVPLGGVVPPASWIAAMGVSTALGRYAGPALRLDVRAGAMGGGEAAQGVLHARLGVDAPFAAAAVEAAAMGDRAGEVVSSADPRGFVLLGRVRVGTASGPSLRVDAAGQGGRGAGEARALATGAWAALPGDDLAYLAAAGWTGGAEVSIPWTRAVRTAVRADVDLDARTLLAVRGLAGYRHPCGCFGLGLVAAHRVGREGVDVTLSVDVAPRLVGSRGP